MQELEIEQEKKQRELQETEETLKKLSEEITELETKRKEKQEVLDRLTEQANSMERKLTAAKKLITGLGREKARWTEDRMQLLEKIVKLIGDCLTCSSFLSYAGPFDFSFRKKMVYDHWRVDINERALPRQENFRIESLLTSDVEISQWASETLPNDELSVQNGILTTRASRWPLCIDPQL